MYATVTDYTRFHTSGEGIILYYRHRPYFISIRDRDLHVPLDEVSKQNAMAVNEKQQHRVSLGLSVIVGRDLTAIKHVREMSHPLMKI